KTTYQIRNHLYLKKHSASAWVENPQIFGTAVIHPHVLLRAFPFSGFCVWALPAFRLQPPDPPRLRLIENTIPR
ncbi:hypothetical protein, partial [Bacteroides acidifaciens]|uniref:hypothetical protein n=1 Tax=Bacteroides acidifaciens TaxID=85831 RepID=UPI00259433E5